MGYFAVCIETDGYITSNTDKILTLTYTNVNYTFMPISFTTDDTNSVPAFNGTTNKPTILA